MIRREAEALVEAGFEVEVLGMRHPGRPRRTSISGVSVTGLPASRARGGRARYLFEYGWFFVLTAGTLTFRHLRRPYAAVQVNTMPDLLVFSAAVPKLLGSRVVAYMHEPSPELAETLYGSHRLVRLLAAVEQAALRYADHAITVTEQLKARYVERGADAGGITVVLNGVAPETLVSDATPPSGQRPGFTVVCHGSVEDRYGQDTIVEAAHLLRRDLPDLRVVLTGRGSGVEELLRLIDARRLQDVVRFEGWVDLDRLNQILRSADVGVVAQKASTYSHLVHTNKMVDYWIFGIPVIASRLRSVAETYDDSTIEYFEPGDPGSLADAIRRLHDDPARREQLARNGRLAEEANGWAAQRATYVGVYERLVALGPDGVVAPSTPDHSSP
jgi:glycosyltransferase involved in cell wall biosynthesis